MGSKKNNKKQSEKKRKKIEQNKTNQKGRAEIMTLLLETWMKELLNSFLFGEEEHGHQEILQIPSSP